MTIASIPTYKPSERIRQFNDLAEFLGDERAQIARAMWNKPLKTVYISDCGELEATKPSLSPSLPWFYYRFFEIPLYLINCYICFLQTKLNVVGKQESTIGTTVQIQSDQFDDSLMYFSWPAVIITGKTHKYQLLAQIQKGILAKYKILGLNLLIQTAINISPTYNFTILFYDNLCIQFAFYINWTSTATTQEDEGNLPCVCWQWETSHNLPQELIPFAFININRVNLVSTECEILDFFFLLFYSFLFYCMITIVHCFQSNVPFFTKSIAFYSFSLPRI